MQASQVTYIPLELKQPGHVQLLIYDAAGRLVRKLYEGWLAARPHSMVWDSEDDEGRPATPGVYAYELRHKDRAARRKMILIL